MAKELPYFKFEPSEWSSGMIQVCSYESRGVFLEMCCLYWSRLGDLPYALALQKLCAGNASLLDQLESNDIYQLEDGKIVIAFLNEQLNQFEDASSKARNAANKRWSNANAMRSHSERNAIREDKRKEKKIKRKDNIPSHKEFEDYALSKKATVDKEALRLKYESWLEDDWHTGGDKPRKIINWKTTLSNTLPYMKEAEQGTEWEKLNKGWR